jgi:hypothetical protein
MAGRMVTGPFFVVEGYDVFSYPDLGSVGSGLEAYDIDCFTLFSADGDVLRLERDGRGVRTSGEILGRSPDALEKALRGALLSPPRRDMFGRRRKRDVNVEEVKGATLPDLVSRFMAILGRD